MSESSIPNNPRWFLTGPTASGKTAVGMAPAGRIGAEIVSLDSMAVYRGMDIGTAKPTAAERETVPHHLIDCVSPLEEFSLAEYLRAAGAAAVQIEGRGRTALFVGGTPLYLKVLLRGVTTGPPPDPQVRRRLRELAAAGVPLHDRLRECDPAAAERLHPRDTKRIIRALEVWELSGRPISQWQQEAAWTQPAASGPIFWLAWLRPQLHARIDARVERMFAEGLVKEVRRLVAEGPLSRTAAAALGYRETLAHLAGERDLAGTIDLVKTRTRQFAKRQETWFRSLRECRRVDVQEPLDVEGTAKHLAETGMPESWR